jgi:hypothetical protein
MTWIRETFGDADDFVYYRDLNEQNMEYRSLVTSEQLDWILLKWR